MRLRTKNKNAKREEKKKILKKFLLSRMQRRVGKINLHNTNIHQYYFIIDHEK